VMGGLMGWPEETQRRWTVQASRAGRLVHRPRSTEVGSGFGGSRDDAVSDVCAVAGAGKALDHRPPGAASSVRTVADPPFVPTDFEPPTALVSDHFRLEPLGPQHNEADHAAWTSSIAHVRSTPGFPDGNWPPPEGMSLDRNLDDLRRHAADFEARTGFTFTVLEPVTGDVIGCVYLYPSESPDADVTVQSWVRASHAELDVPLADTVAAWLAAEWPWQRVHRPGR
jgi:hypothetical protein